MTQLGRDAAENPRARERERFITEQATLPIETRESREPTDTRDTFVFQRRYRSVPLPGPGSVPIIILFRSSKCTVRSGIFSSSQHVLLPVPYLERLVYRVPGTVPRTVDGRSAPPQDVVFGQASRPAPRDSTHAAT